MSAGMLVFLTSWADSGLVTKHCWFIFSYLRISSFNCTGQCLNSGNFRHNLWLHYQLVNGKTKKAEWHLTEWQSHVWADQYILMNHAFFFFFNRSVLTYFKMSILNMLGYWVHIFYLFPSETEQSHDSETTFLKRYHSFYWMILVVFSNLCESMNTVTLPLHPYNVAL